MKLKNILMTSSILFALSGTANAAFTIDGDLSDWGVSQNGNANDWTPNAGIFHTIEDQHSSFLSPGYGGQAYDAEALYAYKDDQNVYVGLATGHNPETAQNPSANSYGAGDFAFDFGINGQYEMGINVKPGWDTFGVEAGVYHNVAWDEGLWADNTVPGYVKSEHPTSILSGDLLGTALLVISDAQTGYGEWTNDVHYFYEFSVSLDLLRLAGWNGESFNIHWTQNCANDSILVDPPADVPEPGSLMLLMIGMTGIIGIRKKSLA